MAITLNQYNVKINALRGAGVSFCIFVLYRYILYEAHSINQWRFSMLSKPLILAGIAGFALLSGCSSTQTAQGPYFQLSAASGDVQAVNAAYQSLYFDQAAQSLAQLNTDDSSTQAEANRLAAQDLSARPTLTAAAKDAMITPPETLDDRLEAKLATLRQLHGTAFDQAFLADQLALRRQNQADLQIAQPRLINPDVRGVATQFGKQNQDDLDALRALQAQAG
jgi:hypothetical protein